MGMVLLRKLNARNIELYEDTRGEKVGVLRKNGEYRYYAWLGFIDREAAEVMRQGGSARGVRLSVVRYGELGEINVAWQDVPEGQHVQGCLVSHGVYGVIPVRLV